MNNQKIKYLLSLFLVVFFVEHASAQRRSIGLTGISYNMSFTTQDTREIIDKFSWRGFGLEYKKFLTPQITIGFTTGWTIFDEKRSDLIELENGAISGTQLRFLNSFPMLLNLHYYLGKIRPGMNPYFGLSLGTYYIIQRLEIGVIKIEKDNWHYALTPEAGLSIPAGSVFIIIGVKYNYVFQAGESIKIDTKDIQYMSLHLGVSIPAW
jgi:hypothetical protein